MFLISVIICFTILYFFIAYLRNKLPPGPIGVPLFGYLPFIGTQPHITFIEKLVPRYGTIFSFGFGRETAIVLNEWNDVREAFNNQGRIFSARPNLYLFNFMNQGHGIVNAHGDYWKNQRKFLSQALKDILANNTLDHIIKEELVFVYKEIDKNVDGFDPHLQFQGCFVNIIAGVVFGQRFKYDDPDIITFLKLIHENFQLVGSKAAPLNFFPKWLNNKRFIQNAFGYNEFVVNVNAMTKFIIHLIQLHIKPFIKHVENFSNFKNINTNVVNCYLTKLASYYSINLPNKSLTTDMDQDNSKQEKLFINSFGENEEINGADAVEGCENLNCSFLYETNLLQNKCDLRAFLSHGNKKDGFTGFDMIMSVIDVFLGGTETTQTVMRWAIVFMSKYQDIQQKVYEELKEFATSSNNDDPSKIKHISFSDRTYLPYSQATILEIQRRASIAPLGFFHSTERDTFLKNFFIPKKSIIIANHWALHHDPSYWNDPYKFEPQRFLDENGEVILDKPSYVPYSIGPRYCFGANIAKNELFTVFVNLLLRYHFTFPSSSSPSPSTDDDLSYHNYSQDKDKLPGNMALTWAPLPYKIVVTPRSCLDV